jgi:Protein of unknown function (DUF3592)
MTYIPIIIPTGTRHTTTVMGYIARQVTCEECQERYLYDAQREAVGQSVTPLWGDKTAGARYSHSWASRALQGNLRQASELVPCPNCGHYQAHAIKAAQKEMWSAVKVLYQLSFAIGSLLAAVAAMYLYVGNRNLFFIASIAAGALTLGFVLWGIRRLRMALFDPNAADRDSRIVAGRHRAYRPEDMNALLQSRQTRTDLWYLGRKKGKTAMIWIVVGLAPLLVSLIMVMFIGKELFWAYESPTWPVAPAALTRSAKIVSRQGEISSDVRYTFSVKGTEYTSDRLWFGPNQDAAANLNRYPSGAQVTVSYLPSNPAVSVLQAGFRWPESYMKPGCVLCIWHWACAVSG